MGGMGRGGEVRGWGGEEEGVWIEDGSEEVGIFKVVSFLFYLIMRFLFRFWMRFRGI